MTNPNKNSRFATLLDDIEISYPFKKHSKKSNTDKGNTSKDIKQNDYNNVKHNIGDNYKLNNKNNNEKNKSNDTKIKDEKIKEEKIINDANFPDLLNNNSIKKTELISNSYIEKLKISKPELTIKESHIKPGWVEIKQDSKTKKIITTYNIIDNDNDDSNNENIGVSIITALADLYYKRTNEYIELWGYDEWEKTFISPNYDYNYFDKLDEKYNIEQNINFADLNE
jgi:hypothetical protein